MVQVRGAARRVADVPSLRAMTDTMRHRGPNDEGLHVDDGIALGARRLSIIDVADGHQPFFNETGRVVAAQNGELYNHDAIREELRRDGHTFRSRCDTEILPHLYETRGVEFPSALYGMFGLAVWDADRRRAVIARDRLGIKPMYYAEVGDVLVFGSELKAVLASGLVPAEIDVESLDHLLTLGFVPGPRTLLRDVKKLQPGHRIVVEDQRVRVEPFWEFPAGETITGRSDHEWRAQFLELLRDAVRIRLMSDVPLGSMLSGGLDSAVITALMATEMSQPVKTFSVGFDGAQQNELGAARQTARALGTDHHEMSLSFDDPVDLDALIWSLDEPVADLSAIGFLALSRLTAEHVTVALSGQGADELLAGYGRYRQAAAIDRWTRAPKVLMRAAATVPGPAKLRRGAKVAAAADPVLAEVLARSEWAESMRSRAARGALGEVAPGSLAHALQARLERAPARGLQRALNLDAQLNLVDDMLHYFDRTSMAYSLEVRVPVLDHRLVELCASMPASFKLRGQTTKALLRDVARDLVPAEVLDRPKVGFFSSSVGRWFERQAGGQLADRLLDPGARYASYVDQTAVARLLQNRDSYRSSKLLLSLLMLELWLSSYLPRATVAPEIEAVA